MRTARRALLTPALALCASLLLLQGCGDKDAQDGEQPAAASPPAAAAPAAGAAGLDAALREQVQAALAKGAAFLRAQQDAKGGFGDAETKIPPNVSYTAMAVVGLVASEDSMAAAKDESIGKALDFLVGFQQENGSIVDDPKITNYATSAAVSALAAARRDAYREAQVKAMGYLEASQIAGDEGDPSYGGFPYKQHQGQPADGSNAFIATNALDAGGLPADSEVRKRVGTYVSKLLNNSEANPAERQVEVDGETRTLVAGDDMGAYYTPVESKAGMVKRSDGKWELRSYGSMTYAALKLMMFAGLPAKDPRVQGVVRWISTHWTVGRNPGFEGAEDPEKAGQQGMFYYLHTVARALTAYERASGQPLVVTDADGRKHDWRAEVAAELLRRQAADGSWRNDVAERWEEGSKTLATGFAMQTLGLLTGRL